MSTPLVIKRETLSRDCENGETPRWASQKYNESAFSSPPSNIEKFLANYASPPSDRIVYNQIPSGSASPIQESSNIITEPLLTNQCKSFTSPSMISLSASQLSSLESVTDLTTKEEVSHHGDQIVIIKRSESAKQTKTVRKITKYEQRSEYSFDPNRRSSGVALTFPSEPMPPPPRPPRSSKSVGHIPRTVEQEGQRKRRRTGPSGSKSTHSLFECSEGCFDMDRKKSFPQLVTITTGPMVI